MWLAQTKLTHFKQLMLYSEFQAKRLGLLWTVEGTIDSCSVVWKVTCLVYFTKLNYSITIQYFIAGELQANKSSCPLIAGDSGHNF